VLRYNISLLSTFKLPLTGIVMSEEVLEHSHGHQHYHEPGVLNFVKRWVFTTNHKDIGTLYLWLSCLMFFVGGTMALLIRAELFQPGLQLVTPDFFNTMTTMHGLVMIFGVIMPAFVGLANWQIPMMIGAPDMAFPRLNNWSFWLLPFAFTILMSTLFMSGSAPNFGWTFYAPLSTTFGPPSTDYLIFSIHLMGLSSILGSINIIATILNLRAPGMTAFKLPLFVWSWLVTAFLLIGIMPVLAGTVTMVLTDRHFGTSFFNAAGGGDPLLFQHLFWFFGHPEVYVLILPAFGIMSEIIPAFSHKKLFGYRSMVFALMAIAFLSYIVWAHHMFTTGMPLASELFFMYATMLIAVPTGVKVFNWVATIYRGAISFETPMLFAIAFVFLFTIGGFSGLMLAIVPADFQYQDTYFVVAHFHYVLVPGALFGIMAGVYFWLPKWTGHMYDERLGKWHFWLTVISLNITFFPMHFLGLAGMPRRIPDYALQFSDFNAIASVGAFIFGFSQLLFLINVIKTVRQGAKAPAKVWEGAHGLEWTLPSPPPYHSFTTPPHVD
jgi:cytochrome c oxidase subunit I